MTRMIERWFPCKEVSESSDRGWGGGQREKAIFTWFAARPPAQARAAVLCSVLPWPDDEEEQLRLQALVRRALLDDADAKEQLRRHDAMRGTTVLDPFSGRGIIPLEAARFNIRASGVDLSPLAALASELLTVYPFRDWFGEKPLPYASTTSEGQLAVARSLATDVEVFFAEVTRRLQDAVADVYTPVNGQLPWAYLWAVTLPCQECGLRFPLVGSYELRRPGYLGPSDKGQSFYLEIIGDDVRAVVHDGPPQSTPTLTAPTGRDGKKARGKSAICPSCRHVHPLEVHKRLAGEGLGRDQLLAVVEQGIGTGRNYRVPTSQEFDDASRAADLLACERAFLTGLPAVPDERIPDNNGATIRPQLYGAVTYGDLMCARQTLATVRLARIISTMAVELLESGNSADYVHALAGYAAANLVRKIRYSTRGATIHLTRQGVGDIFLNEGAIGFSYDFLEVGIGGGAGSWESLAEGYVSTLRLALAKSTGIPTTIVRGSATSLPWADNRFTAVVTDPPYDSMVYYADSSDLLYVWVKRALSSVRPDLAITPDVNGLQDKTEEIIVKEHGKSEHEHRDRAHYDRLIAVAFREMRRVVQNDGVVTIVFGHGEPEVWRRLLGAISQANLVMTGSWPANTESGGQQGKANIETTLTMSCRPASVDRAEGRKANVEAEIRSVVKSRVPDWERWGLAPTDMLMAAAGPAMEVVGKYSEVLDARGEPVDIATFLPLARAAVQEAMAVEVDHHPLETFDARTRFALWWVRLYGRQTVAKSELRWQALAASLELADVRDLIPDIDKGCRFTASNGPLARPTPESAVIDVALAMSSAFGEGLEAVGEVLTRSGRDVDDGYLWAAMAFLADRLPSTDPDVIAWTGILRNRSGVGSAARALVAADARAAEADKQLRLL